MRLFSVIAWRAVMLLAIALAMPGGATAAQGPRVHVIYMGGDDCPPCVAWRANELPRLQKSELFKRVRFTFVVKSIRSPVPAAIFLPSDVAPFKDKLDRASGGRSGSPHFAIMVDGEVYDYYFGTRSAEQMVHMLTAILDNEPYPFTRCLRIGSGGKCVDPA